MQAVVGYHRPESLEEALSLLNRVSPRSVVLAGGTSLNAAELPEPVEMIDLQAIGLDGIRTDGMVVEIGAMVRLFELTAHQAVPELVRLLARREAPSTFRNAATIGGTIGTGDPDSELLAEGETVHVITDMTGRPRALPDKYRKLLAAGQPLQEPGP